MLYIGADHRGFDLKEKIKTHLTEKGVKFTDMGAEKLDKEDDYVDYAIKVIESIAIAPSIRRGILVCGSGAGMAIAGNKLPGLRATIGFDVKQITKAKEDDHVNVLVLSSDYTEESKAIDILDAWLETDYSDEPRHRRRLDKLATHEEQVFKLNYMPR
jgi:ribose 5-phosphate isomerase B